MTDLTPLTATEIAELKRKIAFIGDHEAPQLRSDLYEILPRLLAMVEMLQADQKTLDAMLAFLGIEDSDADPVDHLRMTFDTLATMRHQLAEKEAEVERRLSDSARIVNASVAIGSWLSAALEDENVCEEMKNDIHNWFEAIDTDGGDA